MSPAGAQRWRKRSTGLLLSAPRLGPMSAAGEPGLPVPGLRLPPAQPQDAAALLTGEPPTPTPAGCGLAPASRGSTSVSVSLRAKMGTGSPQLLPPEFSGSPLLPRLPPPALPPSSPALTRRPRSSGPYAQSSTGSSGSSAGPWRPCATSPPTSARSSWTRYRPRRPSRTRLCARSCPGSWRGSAWLPSCLAVLGPR